MEKINAVITGVGGYVPNYVLTNDELSNMVDTNDEWIMTRIGVKERRILNEEGLGTSYLARKAAKQLMQRTGANPDDIDAVIVATSTPDYHFPSTASILCDKLGLKNAFAFDLQAACSGFLFLMETAANFIRSGKYKKIIIVGADKMSSMVDYTDRATCPIFGDGAAAFMLEPTNEDVGVMDAILRTDGKGLPFLHMKAGGSVCPPSYFNSAPRSSKRTSTSPPSLSSVLRNNMAGFLGMMNAVGTSLFMVKSWQRTSLCPSLATMVRESGVKSKYIPFITGRNSSLAVAKRERLILSISIWEERVMVEAASLTCCGRGYSSALWAVKLYIPFW